MRYLIDTHTLLWFSEGSDFLSKEARTIIENRDHELLFSIASLWEISIKASLGKLVIKGDYKNVLEDVTENGMTILPISFEHTVIQNNLPFYHRDPFDRMIISQAFYENIDLISKDAQFDSYLANSKIRRIW